MRVDLVFSHFEASTCSYCGGDASYIFVDPKTGLEYYLCILCKKERVGEQFVKVGQTYSVEIDSGNYSNVRRVC